MKLVTNLTDIPLVTPPVALTIGIFDGVHLGHQTIIKDLHKLTRKSGTKTLLTFLNHPSHILHPNKRIPLLISFTHRLELLKKYGIDLVIALPFTATLSQTSYREFLTNLYCKLPFNELVLGEGASFGKDCRGDAKHLKALAQNMGFTTHYRKKARNHKDVISSGFIRTLVQEGQLKKIKKLLGRPYSIWKRFDQSAFIKENEALYSWSFEETHLCMLPSGVYGIDFEVDKNSFPAIAFLRNNSSPNESSLCITIYLEKDPPNCTSANLSFIEYLHPEIDLTLFQSTSKSVLEHLSTQPSLS